MGLVNKMAVAQVNCLKTDSSLYEDSWVQFVGYCAIACRQELTFKAFNQSILMLTRSNETRVYHKRFYVRYGRLH